MIFSIESRAICDFSLRSRQCHVLRPTIKSVELRVNLGNSQTVAWVYFKSPILFGAGKYPTWLSTHVFGTSILSRRG
jgi:hypothetical protein